VALVGYFWLNISKKAKTAENSGTAENITEQATKGALPSVSNNPFDGKPNLNPAEQSNPIKEVKTNPFE
jgi:hypothetical protein